MTATTRLQWFLSAFKLQGSILPRILPRMIMFCSVAAIMVATYKQGLWVDSDNLKALTGNVACNLVLGLLLVFRTNTAYERFWEGRKAWGTLVITTRNLAREMHIAVDCPTEEARQEKEKALNRLVSFAIAVKCQLRGKSPTEELGNILDKGDIEQLKQANRPPQLITFWLSHYLKVQEQQGHIEPGQRMDLNVQINHLVEGLSGCERILKTPMPLSYGIYLKRLTLLYCLLLPLGLVEQLGWWTPAAIALVSFVLLGIEEIGNEIEDPFGYDFNDLKLDSICATLLQDIRSVLSFSEDGVLVNEPALENETGEDETESSSVTIARAA